MLKWTTNTTVDDAKTASSADAVIFFDLKESGYMLKLSATAAKQGGVDFDQATSL